jgi:hypothetical protein
MNLICQLGMIFCGIEHEQFEKYKQSGLMNIFVFQDITQQMIIDETAVDLIEKCTRLHIFASHHLCQLEFNEFDQKMNTGIYIF